MMTTLEISVKSRDREMTDETRPVDLPPGPSVLVRAWICLEPGGYRLVAEKTNRSY